MMTKAMDWTYQFSSSPEEALALVTTQHFDVVVSDMQMPGMDGYALTRTLAATCPRLPVLGLTAHAGPEAREACLAAGMRAHLPKPLELDALVQAILQHTTDAPRPQETPARDGADGPTTASLVDWPALEALFKGRPQFVERVARKALTTYRNELVQLRGLAAGEGDLAALAFMAHGIKGSAGALQARSIHRQAAEVDAAARAGHRDARALAGGLADQLEALVGELEAHLATDAPRMPD